MSLFDNIPEDMSEVSVRKEDSKSNRFTEDIEHELAEIKNMFDEDISNVKKLFNTQIDDSIENIYRSQIVLLASIYDFYMHNIYKFGFLQIYKGKWVDNSFYNKQKITMEYLHYAMESEDDHSWLLNCLNETNRSITMMSYDSLANNCKIIGLKLKKIIAKLYSNKVINGDDKEALKAELAKVYTKRNSIAHQFDRSHRDGNTLPVTHEEVNKMIGFIEALGAALYDECKQKINEG